ncbi:MAG: glutathione peroxidase [Capsulimonas sp.]|uniref:glutathione peroxidase n=1 Tax=Capsulimonas sp. TaxID=2494211 RepID=UPI003265AA8C
MKTTFPIVAALAVSALVATVPASAKPKYSGPLAYTVKDISAQDVPLTNYRGDVVLIVNTASLCGNTPQYASLETLYEKYKDKGLRILAFPANNFGSQEPGANSEIKEFCTGKYKTTFDLFSKISVKGDDQAPLYKYLTSKDTNPKFGGDVEWNFAKFLIGRDGQVINRFPAGHDPLSDDVVAAVETELGKKGPKAKA